MVTLLLSVFALAAAGGFGGLGASKTSWAVLLILEILLCGAFTSWKPAVAWVYGVSVFVAFCGIGRILVATHPGNLAPIALFVFVCFGGFVAVVSTSVGLILRKLSTPEWTLLVLLGLGLALGVLSYGSILSHHSREARDIVAQLQKIRGAERQYAQTRVDRAFTCNGPDLPGLSGYAWRANAELGTTTKNEARIGSYWVYLECEASSTPHFFSLRARSTAGQAFVYLDSLGQTRRSLPNAH